jgi:hypothetical protein
VRKKTEAERAEQDRQERLEAFDRALDEAFIEIIKMKLEDVQHALENFAKRVEARKDPNENQTPS